MVERKWKKELIYSIIWQRRKMEGKKSKFMVIFHPGSVFSIFPKWQENKRENVPYS